MNSQTNQNIINNLIKLIKKPLVEYIDVLLETVILYYSDGISTSIEIGSIQSLTSEIKEKLFSIKNILSSTQDNLEQINIIYDEILNFLTKFDRLNESQFKFYQILISKFNIFTIIFKLIKFINGISYKLTKCKDEDDFVHLSEEIKWFIAFIDHLIIDIMKHSFVLPEFILSRKKYSSYMNDTKKLQKIIQSNKFQKYLSQRKDQLYKNI